jgi:hypothetical protein
MIKLYKKLMEVRRSVDYLQKLQKNEQQKFDYVSSSQVLGTIRVKMNELGLLLRPQVIKATFHPKGTEKMHVTELKMTMTWVDAESGEKEVNLWYSQGTDQHEKGVGKALTYAEKFFILKYFNIPTDKWDPDAWTEKFGSGGEQKDTQKDPETTQKGSKDESGTEGEGDPPEMPKGPYKNHGERIKAFIIGAGNYKRYLGEEKYYEILKAHGYEKSNKVRKRDDMNAIYKAFKEEVARQLGGEVVK